MSDALDFGRFQGWAVLGRVVSTRNYKLSKWQSARSIGDTGPPINKMKIVFLLEFC